MDYSFVFASILILIIVRPKTKFVQSFLAMVAYYGLAQTIISLKTDADGMLIQASSLIKRGVLEPLHHLLELIPFYGWHVVGLWLMLTWRALGHRHALGHICNTQRWRRASA